jgi:uncharacterized membrane protein YcaP (DUF421 family)
VTNEAALVLLDGGETVMGTLGSLIQTVIGSDEPGERLAVGAVAGRAVVLYAYGLLLVRLGKSRLMGNATALDVVVIIVLGSLLSRGINGSASVASTMVASGVLVGCHWLSTWATVRSPAIGNVIKGHARVLVDDGQVDDQALRRSHLSPEDLEEGMRINGNVEELASVHRAYKERSGQISVVRRGAPPKVVEVNVEDGVKTVRIEFGGSP